MRPLRERRREASRRRSRACQRTVRGLSRRPCRRWTTTPARSAGAAGGRPAGAQTGRSTGSSPASDGSCRRGKPGASRAPATRRWRRAARRSGGCRHGSPMRCGGSSQPATSGPRSAVPTGRDDAHPTGGARGAAWLRQAVLYAGAYAAYGATRWLVIGDRATAIGHAHAIAGLEARLGISIEAAVQRALQGTAAMWLLNHAYLAAQVLVVPAALAWLPPGDRPLQPDRRDAVAALRLRLRRVRRARAHRHATRS